MFRVYVYVYSCVRVTGRFSFVAALAMCMSMPIHQSIALACSITSEINTESVVCSRVSVREFESVVRACHIPAVS